MCCGVCALLAHAVIAVNRTIDVYLILVNYCLYYIGSECAPAVRLCVYMCGSVCVPTVCLGMCVVGLTKIFSLIKRSQWQPPTPPSLRGTSQTQAAFDQSQMSTPTAIMCHVYIMYNCIAVCVCVGIFIFIISISCPVFCVYVCVCVLYANVVRVRRRRRWRRWRRRLVP